MNFTADPTFNLALTVAFAIVALTLVAAPFIASPYGRFATDRFGMSLDPRVGWFLMELPATLLFFWVYLRSPERAEPFAMFVAFVWGVHYLNRGFLMPLLMRVPAGQKGSFSLMVVVIGWVVTSLHGYLNARWATTFHADTSATWLTDPRFLIGCALFVGGMALNLHADAVLRRLRKPGEMGYAIPMGGAYRLVSCPNYLGEVLEWVGFAVATWSLPALGFALWTIANLAPRARSHHRWYRERFPAYPTERRALVPFLW